MTACGEFRRGCTLQPRAGLFPVVLAALAVLPAASHAGDPLTSLPARSIGPTVIGGRVMAIAAHPEHPERLFAGGATSGLWRSANAGASWTPVFDETGESSIGAIAIDPRNPDRIVVGTGEPKPRYGTGIGSGVYASADGGDSWQHLGLAATRRIQRVLLHPRQADRLWVAAVGAAWRDDTARGIYRSDDGGTSWRKVLYVDERTGAADIAMDPSNPDRLLAAMWEFRRKPWSFESGGPGSGLYLSEDGGDNWRRLTASDGLPDGPLGRIGVAFAPSDGSRAYAVIESAANGLFRSDDGGRSWTRLGDPDDPARQFQFGVLGRPWYFQTLAVDPRNKRRVYHSADKLFVSEDAGLNFRPLDAGKGVHPDHHALWINPATSGELWAGTDGGIYVSRDHGNTWYFLDNLPWTQLYNVHVDDERPYNLYTSIQDQANWVAPSAVWRHGGIRGHDWQSVAGGESGPVFPVPGEPRYVYSLANMGHFYITDKHTGDSRVITPFASDPQAALRRNNAPGTAPNPFDADSVYYGSQYLHKSTDRGRTWRRISPDLTSNNPEKQRYFEVRGLTWENFGGELHTTVVAVAPSPVDPRVVWAGTDDGRIQVTRNGGGRWLDRSAALPDGPAPGFWVQQIVASSHEPGVAYAVLNDHRRGDDRTRVYRTGDYGASWRSLVTAPVAGIAWTLAEDPAVGNLLYLGTSSGLYLSFDGGRRWRTYANLPPVQVRGLTLQQREADLVVATFGRGAFIVDDTRAWREIARNPAVAGEDLYLFPVPEAQQFRRPANRVRDGEPWVGENQPYGASFTLWSGGSVADAVIDISAESGYRVVQFRRSLRPGLNRFHWNLRYGDPVEVPSYYHGWPDVRIGDPEVVPGRYTVRIRTAIRHAEQSFDVLPDPRMAPRPEARRERIRQVRALAANVRVLLDGQSQCLEIAAALRSFAGEAAGQDRAARAAGLAGSLEHMADRIQLRFEQDRVSVEPYDEIMRREWPGGVLDWISRIVDRGSDSWTAPSPTERILYEMAELRISRVVDDLNRLLAEEYAAFRRGLDADGQSELPSSQPVRLPVEPRYPNAR